MLIGPASASSLRLLADPPAVDRGRPPAEPAPDSNSAPETSGKQVIDLIKRRSTLLGLVEPVAIVGSLASHPMDTLNSVGAVASSVFHGNFSGAAGELQELTGTAFNPTGALGVVSHVGFAAGALAGGVVGGLEIREGIKTKDPYQALMGGADLIGAASSAATAVGSPGVGMGLTFACSAAKVAMIAYRPKRYTRIQKVDTMFSAAGAVSSAMLRAGVAVVPALIANALLGPTQMLYMNSDKFRARADKVISWVVDHLPHRSKETE